MKMKVFVLLCATVAFALDAPTKPFELRHGLPPPPPADRMARAATWSTIYQLQDNFDNSNTNVWKMRYIENNQFFKAGGPIFIMLGAEWTIEPGWVQGGLMFDMARQHGGAMYYTEHRYYGESFPVSDLSSENLKYLSTEQALEDVAIIIRMLKSQPDFANSKVVVVGGSYGGNMAIWMREQYPDLVHAAWSSSAPVLAKVDFSEYNEVVSQSLSACTSIIRAGVQEIARLLETPAGVKQISNDFYICDGLDVNNFGDVSYFFMTIFGKFAGDVQYSNTAKLQEVCSDLANPIFPNDYVRLVRYYRSKTGFCVGNYVNMLRWYQETGLDSGNSRQWLYQTCTEYGYFQTSTSPNQPFLGIPVDMYHMWCKDIFGDSFTPEVTHAGVAAKNARYGGLNPKVTRVVSTHGTYDPWHSIGLTQDVNAEAPVIIIKDVSHVADFGSISSYDNAALQAAKRRVTELIANWLGQ